MRQRGSQNRAGLNRRRWQLLTTTVLLAVVYGFVTLGDGQIAVAQQPTEAPAAAKPPLNPAPTKSLLKTFQRGGVTMVPLFACSFLMCVFIFERSISLRRGRVIPGPFVKRFLHQLREGQLDRDKAFELCMANGSPVATMFAAGVRKWGRPAGEMDQALMDAGERVVTSLRKYVRLFNGIATVTPLLGLLGTVFGMIAAFNAIAVSDAMGRPDMLAKGISEALITTATGLSIAIPSLTCYMYFLGRVDGLTIELDALGQELVGVISAEAIAEAGETKSRRRREAA